MGLDEPLQNQAEFSVGTVTYSSRKQTRAADYFPACRLKSTIQPSRATGSSASLAYHRCDLKITDPQV
jgi:hypothetical protein